VKRLAAVWLAALLLAACGGDDDGNGNGGNGGGNGGDDNGAERDGNGDSGNGDGGGPSAGGDEYPEAAVDNFLDSCTAQPGATDSECECAIEEIQSEIPYEEFVEVDEALREGRDPPPGSQEEINDAVTKCRE
jgi:hypothetical protein